jgi:hypothetical protein
MLSMGPVDVSRLLYAVSQGRSYRNPSAAGKAAA